MRLQDNPFYFDNKIVPNFPLTNTFLDNQFQSLSNEDSFLYCLQCNTPITNTGSKTEVNGSHQHTCTNPAHVVFTIGCFMKAPGCKPIGKPSTENTWFADFQWQIVFCNQCALHLGWFFTSFDTNFYGLILKRLIANNFPTSHPS